jgi:hypothetical protein
MPAEVLESPPEVISEELSEEKSTDKPRRGRPPKDDQPKPSFFDTLKTRDWERTLAYLYRTAPLIDRTLGGDKKYICKYSSPFDEDQVMREYGSGGYLVRLTESQPGKTETKQIDQHAFTIMNLSYPPQVPLGQWLEDNRNEQWKWAKELLEAKQRAPQPAAAGQANNPADMVRAAKEMAQIFLRETPPAADPAQVIKTAVDAYTQGRTQGEQNSKGGDSELLKTLLPLLMQPKGDDSVVKLLTLQLENEREQRKMDREQAQRDREAAEKRAEAAEKRHSDLMQVVLAKKDDSGTDVIEKFGKMFEMVNAIKEGTGLGEVDDSWMGLVKGGLREALPHLGPQLAGMAGGLLNSLPLGPRPNLPPQNVPRETVAPVPQPEPQPQQDPHLPVYQFILSNFDAVMNKIPLTDGGYLFGDWIAAGPGPLVIERFKAAGTEQIIAVFRTVPQAWQQLGPVEARFRQFLNELMAWAPEEAEEDDPAEPDPNLPVGKVEVLKAASVKPSMKAKGKTK